MKKIRTYFKKNIKRLLYNPKKYFAFFLVFSICISGAYFFGFYNTQKAFSEGLDADVAFLLHANESAGSTSFSDSSYSPKTITRYGSTVTSATGKFGNSLYFDGAGDYVKAGAASDWNFGTSPFTIDFWMNASNISPGTHNGLVAFGEPGSGMTIFFLSGTFYIYSNSSGSWNYDAIFTMTGMNSNTWYHIAIVRNASGLKIYLDGVEKASNPNAATYNYSQPSTLVLGRLYNSTDNYYLNGYIDELRISKGVARWTSNFTPPTSEYSDVPLPGAPGNPTFSNVTTSGLRVNWTAASNATSYKIERAPDNSGSPGTFTEIATGVTNLYYDDSGLTSGTTYWYRVRGTNGGGDGNYTSSVSQGTTLLSFGSINISYSTTTGDVGADGVCTVSSGTVNLNTSSCAGRATADAVNFSVTANTASGQNQITLSTTPTGLAIGDDVMIINLQGTGASYANVGQYEIKKISSINSNTLTLNSNLTNSYDGTTQKIMVQRVPFYTNISVSSGATLTANAWDGTKGGVLAFKGSGTFSNAGTIDMSGKGYRPGNTYNGGTGGYQGEGRKGVGLNTNDASRRAANGEGGGAAWDTSGYNSGLTEGGGGGGYGSGGGIGTANHTSFPDTNSGGAAYGTSTLATMFFGSAGGAGGAGYNGSSWFQGNGTTDGKGGAGGGIIYIQVPTISNTGTIKSNGATGNNGWGYTTSCTQSICGGGGGSGAGGSVYINGESVTLGSGLITAIGGATTTGGAGSYGSGWGNITYGGKGGDGRVAIFYSQSVSGTTNPSSYSGAGSLTGSVKTWEVNGIKKFTITQSASSSNGIGGTYGLVSLINYEGTNAGQYGGQFSWHPSQFVYGGNQVMCSGSGGYASQNNSGFGWGTSHLVACSSTISGSSYTVSFTVRPTTNFPALTANDISAYMTDASSTATDWTNNDLNFATVLSPLPLDAFMKHGDNFSDEERQDFYFINK